jgi:hypothetical protein
LPLWIRPFLTTFWEPQLGQVGVDITVHGGLSYLYPYIWRTTEYRTHGRELQGSQGIIRHDT